MKYAISLLSMAGISCLPQRLDWFPRCLFRDPSNAIMDARDAGFDGVQAYPMPGLAGYEQHLLCYEEFWGDPWASLEQAVKNRLGLKRIAECLKVAAFSPTAASMSKAFERLAERPIPRIVHDFNTINGPRDIVEIHPAMGMTAKQIRYLLYPICLDTFHLTRAVSAHEALTAPNADVVAGVSPFGSTEQEWFEAIPLLAYSRTEMIHIHTPTAADFTQDSLAYRLVEECLRHIPYHKELLLVAEYPPTLETLCNRSVRIETAKLFLETMKRLADVPVKKDV
jgi:hypothetical protein